MIENTNFTTMNQLNQDYPDDFLQGRYRQDSVYYQNKIYAIGGGKMDGDSFPLDVVRQVFFSLNEKFIY